MAAERTPAELVAELESIKAVLRNAAGTRVLSPALQADAEEALAKLEGVIQRLSLEVGRSRAEPPAAAEPSGVSDPRVESPPATDSEEETRSGGSSGDEETSSGESSGEDERWEDEVRSAVRRVASSRQSRSVVAPASGLAKCLLLIKGTYFNGEYADDADETIELRVINTDGGLQPAASFLQFMRMAFVEILALRDEFVHGQFPFHYAEDSEDEVDLWHSDIDADYEPWCEIYAPNRYCTSLIALLLQDPNGFDRRGHALPGVRYMPWPFLQLLETKSNVPKMLRRLVAPARRDALMLSIVISRSSVAGIAHVFEGWISKYDLFPRLEDLQDFLESLNGDHFDGVVHHLPRPGIAFVMECNRISDGVLDGHLDGTPRGERNSDGETSHAHYIDFDDAVTRHEDRVLSKNRVSAGVLDGTAHGELSTGHMSSHYIRWYAGGADPEALSDHSDDGMDY